MRRGPTLIQPGVLKVAVVGIEFPDVKHNDKITPKDWENEFFSRKLYASTCATGQQVYGSVNDFYIEQSSGTMRIEGKMLGWIEVAKNRMDYSPTPHRHAAGRPQADDKRPVSEKKGRRETRTAVAVDKPAPDKPSDPKRRRGRLAISHGPDDNANRRRRQRCSVARSARQAHRPRRQRLLSRLRRRRVHLCRKAGRPHDRQRLLAPHVA